MVQVARCRPLSQSLISIWVLMNFQDHVDDADKEVTAHEGHRKDKNQGSIESGGLMADFGKIDPEEVVDIKEVGLIGDWEILRG